MTVRKRSLAAVLLVLAFAASAWSAARVRQRIKPFELPHRVKGHLEWIVRGEVAHVLEGGDMMLEKPNVHIAATESEPGRDITAKKAMVTDKKDTMNFEGDVTVVSTDGASLAADRLTWKVKAQMANTDSHVVIKRGRMDLSGDGLDAQVKRDMFKIHSNVKLIVRPKKRDNADTARASGAMNPGRPVTVISKGSMTFAGGVAVFVGRPKVISGDATMICDRLDVHMDPETEEIKKAVAKGNVILASEEFDAECGEAVWVPDSDDLRLSVDVVAVERGTKNTLRTNLAYLNPEGNRTRCVGPAVVTFRSKKKDIVEDTEVNE